MEDSLPGATPAGNFGPLLYIGTDGRLYGSWPFVGTTFNSANPVNDGLWHYAIISYFYFPRSGNTFSLSIDGTNAGTQGGLVNPPYYANPTYVTFGAGINGGSYLNERYYGSAGSDYFNGQLASISMSG